MHTRRNDALTHVRTLVCSCIYNDTYSEDKKKCENSQSISKSGQAYYFRETHDQELIFIINKEILHCTYVK